MPVTVEQVRRRIEAAMGELEAMGPAPGTVLLWSQHHPDGPDWAVSQDEYLAWRAQQPDRDALPTLSVTIDAANRIVTLSARRGSAQVSRQHSNTSQGGLRVVVTTKTAAAESHVRVETFTIAVDGSDRAQIIAAAARSYVSIAEKFFTPRR